MGYMDHSPQWQWQEPFFCPRNGSLGCYEGPRGTLRGLKTMKACQDSPRSLFWMSFPSRTKSQEPHYDSTTLPDLVGYAPENPEKFWDGTWHAEIAWYAPDMPPFAGVSHRKRR